jgi:hypothetical protein
MSKLYGYLTNERGGESTRAAHRSIEAIVQTESARIVVTLLDSGEFTIAIKRGDRASGYGDTTARINGNAHAAQPIDATEITSTWSVELRRVEGSGAHFAVVIHAGPQRTADGAEWIDASTIDTWEYRGISRDDAIARAAAIAATRGATLVGFADGSA